MSLTLGQARPLVARVVDNGLCPDDSRVAARINEAVARLNALGDWVGSIARYAVTVDVPNRAFSIPDALQSVIRAAVCPDSVIHSTGGTLISDNEFAFVLESSPVLSLQQTSASTFRIVGPVIPDAVDVVGNLKLATASADSDPLAVDDAYALKLMILALFREENNQLEQAQALIQQAVAHLKAKTDNAVTGARKILFTSMAAGIREGTLGYARAKLALALTDGLRLDDHKLIEVLGEAERRLMQQGREWKSYLFKTSSGILAVPREIDTVLRIDLDNVPTRIQSHWYDYTENGWGYKEEVFANREVVHRGEHAVHTILPSTGTLTLLTDADEAGLGVTITGRSADGLPVSESLTLAGAVIETTANSFAEILSVTKDVGYGNFFILRDGIEVVAMTADETNSLVQWYAIPSSNVAVDQIARVIARPRWLPKLRDTDLLQVDNIPALTNMAMAVLKEREGSRDDAEAYEARAMRYYEAQYLNREVQHKRRVEVQGKAFGGGGIHRFR